MSAVPGVALAQRAPQVYRIGFLSPTTPDVGNLSRLLTELGYVSGRNAEFVQRFASGKPERLPALAAELVASKVDVIVATAPPAIRAARGATKTIPIVMAFSGDDPVASGFAQSLSRPGGNVTGVTTIAHDFAPKWIELMREAVPSAKRIAVLRMRGAYAHDDQIAAMRAVAAQYGTVLQVVNVRDPNDYPDAFAAMASERADALVIMSSPELNEQRGKLAELALEHRLPSIFQFREYVVAGGLMSYGPDIPELFAQAATYVDRILKGANPAEMPIQQPTKFRLAINSRTAAALGLALPKSLTLRADEQIGD